MSNGTPTREQVEAWLADLPPGPFTTVDSLPGNVYCDDSAGTIVADCGPFKFVAYRYDPGTLAAFFAAAPTLARAYLATLDRAEAAELKAARLGLAVAKHEDDALHVLEALGLDPDTATLDDVLQGIADCKRAAEAAERRVVELEAVLAAEREGAG